MRPRLKYLEEQAVYVFIAQAGAGDTSTTHSRRFGSVDATPGACTLGLHIEGRAVQAFAAKVDCQATAVPCRPGSVDATPGASAPDLRPVRSALSFVAQVGADDGDTVTDTTCRLGSVDATPEASAPDLRLMGPASVLATQVNAAGTATVQAGRLGFVDATPYVDDAEATASTASRRGLRLVATTPGADADEDQQLPAGGVVVFTPPLFVPTSDSPILLQWHQLIDAAAHMTDSHDCPVSAVVALSLSGNHPRRLSWPVPQHMSSPPRSVTTYLHVQQDLFRRRTSGPPCSGNLIRPGARPTSRD